jgi:PAS domain S-box-containing protein
VLEWWAKDGANSARASRQELIASQLDASAFRASGDATLLLDMNGAILAMNPAGSRMMGVTEEEAIGHRAREIVSVTRDDGTPYAERQSIVRQVVADGKERTTTAEQLTRRDGTATDVERTIAALRDPTRGTSSGQ